MLHSSCLLACIAFNIAALLMFLFLYNLYTLYTQCTFLLLLV
jgi:hypothetical protein